MFEKVCEIIGKYTEVKNITPDSVLTADLGLTSFDVVSIVTDFEEEFNVEIPDSDITGFVTISDIMDYIQERI